MKRFLDAVYRSLLQPKAMLGWAIGFATAFAIVHLLGWREFTTVLSGTIPAGGSAATASLKAGAYLATYFGTVVGAPILMLAAAINVGFQRIIRGWRGKREASA